MTAEHPSPEDTDTEAMLRTLVGSAFDSLVGAVAVTSVDDRFLAVNDAACRLLGRSNDELKQLSFRDISHPDDGEADDRARAALVDGADTVTVRKRFVRPDGTNVTVDVNLARMPSPTGRWLATLVQYTPVLPVDIGLVPEVGECREPVNWPPSILSRMPSPLRLAGKRSW